jgi:hypothetical protein
MVSIGFDIQSGNGNLGTNISLESVKNYAFAFNNRPADYSGTATSGTAGSFTDSSASFDSSALAGGAWMITSGTGAGQSGAIAGSTSTTIFFDFYTTTGVVLDSTSKYEVYKTKALGNKFTNVRQEGDADNPGQCAIFYPGALSNVLAYVFATGIPTTQWTKGVAEGSNWCQFENCSQLVAIPMWLPLNATPPAIQGFSPSGLAVLGAGYGLVPRSGRIVGLSATCDSLAGVTGYATLTFISSNTAYTDLNLTLNANTTYGNVSYLKQALPSDGFHIATVNDIDLRLVLARDGMGIPHLSVRSYGCKFDLVAEKGGLCFQVTKFGVGTLGPIKLACCASQGKPRHRHVSNRIRQELLFQQYK